MDGTDGRIIVITGASGGIGAEVARQLGRQGHRLVLAARRQAELEQVADEVAGVGGRAVPVVTDVTRRLEVERLRDEALVAFGRVDVWINNAGRGITRAVLELTDDDIDEMMTVNVRSALYGMQAIVPHFQQRGAGHLINVSSFLGRVPLASHRSVYSAAKAALNSLTANLRMDLRREHPGIRVSLVMPGVVTTDFARNALGGLPPRPPAAVVAGTMRPQTPEEVGAMIAGLVDRPVSELYTNPASREVLRRYIDDVDAFEEALTGAAGASAAPVAPAARA
jgi:short-subunit dehydrogenase